MTVKELRDYLAALPAKQQKARVVLACDEEGNGFANLAECTEQGYSEDEDDPLIEVGETEMACIVCWPDR